MKKNNHIISYYVFYIFFFLVIKWSIIYNKYKKLIKIAYNNYYASAAPLLLRASQRYQSLIQRTLELIARIKLL